MIHIREIMDTYKKILLLKKEYTAEPDIKQREGIQKTITKLWARIEYNTDAEIINKDRDLIY
jgi:predicted metal-binding protein